MEPVTPDRDFIPYPTNRVVGTIGDAKSARAAVEGLLQAGFDRDDVDILHGDEDVSRLDPTGEDHGFLARFQRTLIRTIKPNEEYRHLMGHVEDVRAGRFVIMVRARERERRIVAADILNHHGARFIGFYGRWAWKGLPPDVPAPSESATEHERAVIDGPARIASLFAEAWNARDADALAALFDADAEFVNVTGLWWHDREAIRQAHAYGLARIFNESTLTVEETRVKNVRSDVAVVHARMRLSGQTPLGEVEHPRSRATVFSFVVHRAGSEWLCASAQNTDIVPGMETNIVDEEGTFRSANYRSGDLSARRH